MSIIRVLPEEIANRIAAGEVIERPASVVKELVENAIDAGARRIVVHARQGGRNLIQVIDDGSGMDRDDVLLALEPHATSKIREAGDIERIVTLGFRGEALPSIAAVSRFRMQSRLPAELAGNEVVVDGGAMRDFRECGCAPGTNVRVGQLFYNMPGRRKFLHSVTIENEHIREIVLLQALAHPGIAFELLLDDQPALEVSAATDAAARVAMLMGRETFEAMLPVDYSEDGITVTGFVARPGLTRAARREQRFFVNGRPAVAEGLYAGVREAYHTLVMRGRYPPLVLYLEIPPERVDVNVHPAKREVRFRENQLVSGIVAAAVRRALRGLAGEALAQPTGLPLPATPESRGVPPAPSSAPAPVPAFHFERAPEQSALPWSLPAMRPAAPAAPEAPHTATPATTGAPPEPPAAAAPASIVPGAESAGTVPGSRTAPSTATRAEIRGLRVIGVLGTLYLVAESSSGLVLVDQHAAHERILFERLLRAAAARAPERQPLLLPVTIDLAPADAAFLRQHEEHFIRLGFGLEAFGGNTLLITAVPMNLPRENIAGLLCDILDELRQSAGTTPRIDEVRIAQAACKHAVKAEDPLSAAEIAKLLEDLAAAEMPYTCPHGRPVMITLPHGEIERRFGRRT